MAAASVPVLVGPTAIGKTAVALALARYWPLEVVSADSRQIYRRLDVATGKATAKERARVPHHGLDLIDPGTRHSAGRYGREASRWIEEIRARGRMPVVVGGTGLYVRALAEGLFAEPEMDAARRRALDAWIARLEGIDLVRWAGRLDAGFAGGGRQRATRAVEVALLTGRPLSHWQTAARSQGAISPWYVVLTAPRAVLHQRIERRVAEMMRRGLVEEAAAVLSEGHAPDAPGLDGVGTREAIEFLLGKRTRDTVAGAIVTRTRQYAKRQETWFRHQLTGDRLTLDASRSPDAMAADIAAAWDARPR